MTRDAAGARGAVPRRRPRRGVWLVGLLGAAAYAGVQLVDGSGNPYAWDLDSPQPNVVSGKVTYYLDPGGTRDFVTGPVTDLDACRAGIATWEVATSRLRFQEDASRSANGRNASDRVNYVGWATSGLGPLTLAVTFPTRSGAHVLDMDVLFNESYQWNTGTPGTPGVADIQSIMTHEWGHALGADHVPLEASTMYFASSTGSIAYRSLSPDDVALVGSIYPNDAFRSTTGTLSGRVTRDGATDHRAIHVVAVSLVTGEPAASTLTRPDGTWAIPGLPRGAYRVVAAPTVPLEGAMNSFWTTGSTSFLPAILRTRDTNPAPARTVTVQPDMETVAPEFAVRSSALPFEPNDTMGQATLIQLGDAVAARLESGGDEDWYAFDAVAGDRVTVAVLAWNLGSTADPAVTLTNSVGQVFGQSDDVRSDALFGTRPEGPDLDARVIGASLPNTGRYLVKVRNQAPGTASDNFYALFVTPASDAPSAALTDVDVVPGRVDADGASTLTVRVTPRKETAEDVGPGATVTLTHDGAGALGSVRDVGDGTYEALLTAPTTPGRDRLSVTVTTTAGSAALPDAGLAIYLGPFDGTYTGFSVTPRRIAADGVAQATLRLVPRDALGEALGSGRSVLFTLATCDAQVGPAAYVSSGTYEATVTAGTAHGAASVAATVDGVRVDGVGTLRFGFPLDEVLTQTRADAEYLAALPGLKSKALSALAALVRQTDRGLAALEAGRTDTALAKTKKALAKLASAAQRAKGALPALGTADELASAIRQSATDAREAAVIETGRDQRRADAADDLVAEGDAFLDAGDPKRAAARYLRAWRALRPLQP